MARSSHSLEEMMASEWPSVIDVLRRRPATRLGHNEVLFDLRTGQNGFNHLDDLLSRLALMYLRSNGSLDFETRCFGVEDGDPSFVGVRLMARSRKQGALSAAIINRFGAALKDALLILSDEIHAAGQQQMFPVPPSGRCEWLGDRTGSSDALRPLMMSALGSEPFKVVVPDSDQVHLSLCPVAPLAVDQRTVILTGQVAALDISNRKLKINGIASNAHADQSSSAGKRVFICDIGRHSFKKVRVFIGEDVTAELVENEEIVNAGRPQQSYDLISIELSTK